MKNKKLMENNKLADQSAAEHPENEDGANLIQNRHPIKVFFFFFADVLEKQKLLESRMQLTLLPGFSLDFLSPIEWWIEFTLQHLPQSEMK